MHIRVLSCLLALAIAAPLTSRATDDTPKPTARIELSGWLGGVGIGYTSAEGALVFDGQVYPITLVGMTALEVGFAYLSGSGDVYGLDAPREIEGRYRAFTGAATLLGGVHAFAAENGSQVYINLDSQTWGVSLTVGPSSLRIFLKGDGMH